MLLFWVLIRNWRSPLLITVFGLILVLCSVIWFTDRNNALCGSDRMAPGEVCRTPSSTGSGYDTQTYEQVRDERQTWTPIAIPLAAVTGLSLVAIGLRSAWAQGILYPGQKRARSHPAPGSNIATSLYAASIAQRIAAPPPPPPPAPAPMSAPPPPPTLHHDL